MKNAFFASLLMLAAACLLPAEKSPVTFDRYHTPKEIAQVLDKVVSSHPKTAALHSLAASYGGMPVAILEIGPQAAAPTLHPPAILVVANMEGTSPLASEAALILISQLLDHPDLCKEMTWYILPLGNPDAAARFFGKPLVYDTRNDRPVNDDTDDQTDEDGYEDLNGDGLITLMRVKDPAGEWLPVSGEPRLMKRADASKGEKGIYKLYGEGEDNDGDGQYNEDPPGGVNTGLTFPQLFPFFNKTAGEGPGSEPEVYALFRFVFGHPEIAMTLTLGESNFCMVPPRSNRRSEVDLTKIKIPKYIASFIGADPNKTYTLEEIKETLAPMAPPGMEINDAMIAQVLQLGAVVNPLPADLAYYNHLSEEYKEFQKSKKLDAKRLESPDAKDGSFELWSYYQLGLPTFSLDFWTLPELAKEDAKEGGLTPDKLEKMSSEELIALGPEKIGEFMKSAGAPVNFKPEMVINMVKGGQLTPKKIAEMLKQMPKPKSEEGGDPREKALLAYSDKYLEGKGFIPWKSITHKQLGEVEVGGPVPYAASTPPPQKIQELLDPQVSWIFTLAKKIPRIAIQKTEVQALGGNLYRLKAWVENRGYLPYPTAMGSRNGRVPSVAVTLEGAGFRIVEGYKRSLIREIPGGQSRMVSWIVLAEKPVTLTIRALSAMAGQDAGTISLGGQQ